MRKERGITLIALIITIIILLILAMVTIRILMNQGIIKHAQNATEEYNNAQNNETEYLTYAEGEMDKYAGVNGSGTGEKEDNDWAYAWTYTEEKGWSSMITAGNPAEGDIVAKFYKTGNKITPPSIAGLEFEEGDEYHMTIEGKGEMGWIASGASGNAWGAAIMAKATGQASEEPLIIPYVTEVTVENGITNISMGAFYVAAALNTISMPNSISSIDHFGFAGCASLTNQYVKYNRTYCS